MAATRISFPDHKQNFWQISSIQGASQAFVAIMLGGLLTKQHGACTALTSICIGNLLLWVIGLGIISALLRNSTRAA